MTKTSNILALDVGGARVGLAVANTIARLPSPLGILENDSQIFDRLQSAVQDQDIQLIVVGLPRNMAGEETGQSAISRRFAESLKQYVDIPVVFADESLSTKRAEQSRYAGKSQSTKHLDDIAACFILEEYLREHK